MHPQKKTKLLNLILEIGQKRSAKKRELDILSPPLPFKRYKVELFSEIAEDYKELANFFKREKTWSEKFSEITINVKLQNLIEIATEKDVNTFVICRT